MGQDTLTPSSDQCIDRHEQRLRDQLSEGCRLARELDERVRSIPIGRLSVGGYQGDSATASSELRCSLAIATADVVAAFNKSIKVLLQSPDCTLDSLSAASSPLQTALHASPQQKAINSSMPSSAKAINLVAEQTKSPSHATAAGWQVKATSAADPCKHQSNRASVSATPSPPRCINSPLQSATSDMSDGSPKPNQPDLPADEANTANPMKAVICRKRKLQPKMALKMPAGSAETGENNTPPDDGHTWRKYGQKNILGSHYPRSYYRCTHKTDTGCPALKQVQRCDEDDAFFDVVYKGYHTCRSADLDKECWPLAFPQGLSSMLPFPSRTNIPSTAASLMLASMSAAAKHSSTHHASLDNLLCHVASVASSDAVPSLPCNPELSVTQALTPTSAKLSAASSFRVMNPALQTYSLSSGQALLAMINRSTGPAGRSGDNLQHTALPRNPSAAVQGESTTKDQLQEGTAAMGAAQDEHGSSSQYTAEQGQNVNPLEDWAAFQDSNSEEVYKRLASLYAMEHGTSAPDYDHDAAHRRLLQPHASNYSSLQKQEADAANSAVAVAFDDDDDLLNYLDS